MESAWSSGMIPALGLGNERLQGVPSSNLGVDLLLSFAFAKGCPRAFFHALDPKNGKVAIIRLAVTRLHNFCLCVQYRF